MKIPLWIFVFDSRVHFYNYISIASGYYIIIRGIATISFYFTALPQNTFRHSTRSNPIIFTIVPAYP